MQSGSEKGLSLVTSIIALVVQRAYRQKVKTVAAELGAEVIWTLELQGVVKTVADLRPLVLLIDLESQMWAEKVWALKTSPATRRLGMIGFTHPLTDDLYEQALALQVDEVFDARDDPKARILETLKDRILIYARRSDIELQAALGPAVNQPLPVLAWRGLQQFNAGEYYEAHETLEHAWVAEPGPIRNLYRGVLQIAVAYYHIQRGNYWGALKMFLRSLQWLEPLPDVCQGIDIAKLRSDAWRARQTMERLGPERLAEFDTRLLQSIIFDEDFVTKELE